MMYQARATGGEISVFLFLFVVVDTPIEDRFRIVASGLRSSSVALDIAAISPIPLKSNASNYIRLNESSFYESLYCH
jgi:hypothetical protein